MTHVLLSFFSLLYFSMKFSEVLFDPCFPFGLPIIVTSWLRLKWPSKFTSSLWLWPDYYSVWIEPENFRFTWFTLRFGLIRHLLFRFRSRLRPTSPSLGYTQRGKFDKINFICSRNYRNIWRAVLEKRIEKRNWIPTNKTTEYERN